MEQLLKYLFVLGILLLVAAGVMWRYEEGVILWRVATSFLLIGIGARLLWGGNEK